MSNEVIARINISTPSGRKIVRELENHKAVKMEYPLSESIVGQNWHSHDEVWQEMENRFNKHYGTNYKFK